MNWDDVGQAIRSINVGHALEVVLPVAGVLIGIMIERRAGFRRDAEQRFDDQHQRWRARRQDLITRLQQQVFLLAEGASTAITMRNTPTVRRRQLAVRVFGFVIPLPMQGRPVVVGHAQDVDIEAPWFRRWNEARVETFTATELLGDKEIEEKVHAFIVLQDEVANSWLSNEIIGGRPVSITEQTQLRIMSLQEPLNEIMGLLAQRHQELEGTEPTFRRDPWWKL